jgi:predicted nucleic acid-binding protein
VKHSVGILPTERNEDVWFIKKLLQAHRAGEVEVYTSILSLAECVAVEQGQSDVPMEVQEHFRNLLTNGQYVTLAQTTPRTARIAQDLRWIDKLVIGGPDAIHIASALEVGAAEMLTTDDRLKKPKVAAAVNQLATRLRIMRAADTGCLPGDYRQGRFLNGDSEADR